MFSLCVLIENTLDAAAFYLENETATRSKQIYLCYEVAMLIVVVVYFFAREKAINSAIFRSFFVGAPAPFFDNFMRSTYLSRYQKKQDGNSSNRVTERGFNVLVRLV